MNGDNKKNNDIDAIIDRSFNIYQANSRNLERVFAILCGAGLIFFFLAIVPYFFIQFEKQRVTEQYDNTVREINQTESAINEINMKLNRIIQIREEAIPAVDSRILNINTQLNQIESESGNFLSDRILSLRNNLTFQQQRLDDIRVQLNNELSNLESNKTNFENDLNREKNITLPELEKREKSLASQREHLTAQWENIQSPVGEIPTAFRDLVAVFPFSLSLGFFIYVYFFSKTLAIRTFLHYLKKKNSSFKDSEIDREIALTSPLWVDPINSEQNKVLSFLILIIPLVIFVASTAMILYSWNVEESDPVISETYRIIYYIINTLGLGFFAYGYWRIINELRHYSNRLSSWLLTRDEREKR
jgi:CII-binding regulator of phage lambda lysogenization HflD